MIPAVSDEILLPQVKPGAIGHRCEHPGCTKWAGFGFSRPRQAPHWYCFEHREDGEDFR